MRLKVVLALGVKKLGLVFVVLKLGKFPLFNGFFNFLPLDFPDLYNFWNLAKFGSFDFPDILASSLLLPQAPNPTTSPLQFLTLSLDMFGNPVVFSIKVSGVAIFMKS